ncbi:glycosyltransferase involved in cell wall biosynthesis [Chryseobacterium ginsenosidimutans]|uniref:glycosyltransferase family 2 protein n=1 Tax=Chryseobacterium ginsenosidimutans TaxID=687846 RepID=UPI002782310A|nr:glycosyltransferase family A protein [Chryseobacterium ginsenosidimutans]MDQ0592873.1 glycosyltransferase involved in cell wall biosynthesis [Chryseobacterium ginsenosidimutans]
MNKVSILIANYNNGKYFRDCYNSIVSQSYENWEAIIVDDCSTDDSIKIIQDLIKDDERFRLYHNESNKGCGYTKKKCVDLSTGDLCTFLDPDDALYDYSLECSVDEFRKTNKIIATYSQLIFCNEKLNPGQVFSKIKQISNNRFFFNTPIQLSALFVFKKEAYLATDGINPNLKSAVDQDLYLKLLEVGDAKFIDEILYKYRLHPDGISQQNSKQNAKDSFARVIHQAMKRRKILSINNIAVPKIFTTSEEIYNLLNYQTKIPYRLINKIKSKLNI